MLKVSCGVYEAKRHDKGFGGDPSGAECRLPLVSICNTDHVVGITDVKCGEVPCVLQLHDCLSNQRKWVPVFDSASIKSSVVNADSEATILHLCK